MVKRRFTSLALVAVAAALLAGCGGYSKPTPASPGATSPTPTSGTPATSSGGGGGYGY